MRNGFKTLSTIIVATTLILGACSQDTCPGAGSAGKGKPPGKGGEADQKLFNEDKR